MVLWKRILITVVAVLVVSFLAGILWQQALGFRLPSYLAGVIGGLAAVPVWEFLRRIGPAEPGDAVPPG